MLLDSGSVSSLLSKKCFEQHFVELKDNLRKTNCQLIAANGEKLEVLGQLEVSLKIGSQTFQILMIVADLEEVDGIIGLNFLRDLGMNVELGAGVMHRGTWSIRLLGDRGPEDKSCIVRLKERVCIPAGQEIITPGVVTNKRNMNMKGYWLLDPVKSLEERNVSLMKAVVINESEIPLTLINETEDDIELEENKHVAVLSPVQEIIGLNWVKEDTTQSSDEGNKYSNNQQLPNHLSIIMNEVGPRVSDMEKKKSIDLLIEFQDVFVGPDGKLGRTDMVKHSIITGDAQPIKHRPRRVPYSQIDAMNAELEKMLKQDIIQPSHSPWAAPIVLVKKPNGELRFCVDYRSLNEITKKDGLPLPRIGETLDALGGSSEFCVLDLASGFWQCENDPDSIEKTAFCTPGGLYEFKCMPMGLCNAPSTFTRLMIRVLDGLKPSQVLIYIDDLCVHGKTFNDTLDSLRMVFNRLRHAGLKLKPKKCQLFKEEVKYLGHIVSRDGVRCDPEKVKAVEKWPAPRSVKEVRAILGTASYYRKFIHNFSQLSAPLTNLLHKGVKFYWSDECQKAFELIKYRLTTAPILAFPSSEGEFILDTDACDHGLAAVLSQILNGEERVIAYASRTLNAAQKAYCVTYKELLAVRLFVEHFKVYLYGRRFKVRTDHSSLRWLKNFKKADGMVMRWITYLDTYDIIWVHRAGRSHGNADRLSR